MVASEPVAPSDGSREHFQPPHPLRAAALMLAPVALLVGLWVWGVLPAPVALGFSVLPVFLALLEAAVGAYELRRSRRLGDALLRAYPGLPPVSSLAAWRSAELTSPRKRRQLAGHVRQMTRETEACTRPGAPPVDGAVLDESLVILRRLECRLETLSEPVAPLGMLDLHSLVTADSSPLYFSERAGALPAALAQAFAALEPA
jgi:hypothetical protein